MLGTVRSRSSSHQVCRYSIMADESLQHSAGAGGRSVIVLEAAVKYRLDDSEYESK